MSLIAPSSIGVGTPEEQIDAIVLGVFNEAGKDAVTFLQQLVATQYPPSSRRGEAPHRRTGRLQEEITFEVIQEYAITELAVTSMAPYSIYLDDLSGGGLDRPYMSVLLDEFPSDLIARLQNAFS